MNLQDAMGYVNFSFLTILPGEQSAVFRAQTWDFATSKLISRFYQVGFDANRLTELDLPEGASNLCAVNGKDPLAFVKGQDLYAADPVHNRRRLVVSLPVVPQKLIPASDGTKIMLIGETPSAEDTELREQGIAIADRETPTQIFSVELKSGKITRLTSAPTVKGEADWSPDGQRIVYTELTREIPKHPARAALKILDLSAGRNKILVAGNVRCSCPRWSPDGKTIAFLRRKPSTFADDSLAVIGTDGGTVKNFTAQLDRRVVQYYWTGNGELRFRLAEGMFFNLWKASTLTGEIKRLSEGKVWEEFHVRPGGRRLIYTAQSLNTPREVYTADLDGQGEKRLTDFNARLRADAGRPVEIIQWRNSAGLTIEGIWVPASRKSRGAPPLIVENHGSTPGAFAGTFFPLQRHAAALGFSTLLVNYRGSSNYGQSFMEAVAGCWCTGPAEDCVKGAKKLIAAKTVDPKRIGATGASGGALMSGAAIGLYPSFFRTAVLTCGWYDFTGLYRHPFWQNVFDFLLGGSPQEVPERYRKESPISYAAKVTIPVLLYCGELDTAAPIIQTELYHAALCDHTTVEFIRYANEGHGFRQMNHILDWHNRSLAWFRKYLKINAAKHIRHKKSA